MNVKAITHRKKPVLENSFTGVTYTTHMIPWQIDSYLKVKEMVPNLVDLYAPREAIGISILSIDKKFPGQGITAGQLFLGISTSKIAIVVDKDIDVTNLTEVLHAVATRWQPYPASLIMPQIHTMGVDPSMTQRFLTSKIIIDATQQLPEEGGPKSWPEVSRVLLQQMAPQAFDLANKKWPEYWKEWGK
jgi:4-hydroxy-3-polyprenylbenzoate decarboxylase